MSRRHSRNFLPSTDGQPNDDAQSVTRTSLFSSNYTISNLVGTGRVLGNLYSFAGRRLERTVGTAAHKAGFGPTATYEKIRQVYYTDWKGDENESELSYCLIFELTDYPSKG